MPRRQMDYSTTHFYKIVCRDLDVKDMYVGHTTDFKTRKGCHKRVCNNSNDKQHNRSLYNCIREYGGWENWDMVLIETKALNNSLEARKREREHIEDLKPSLNEINAYRSSEELKQYKKQWSKDNEENVKDYKHNWHLKNRDKLTEIKRVKYQENKEEQIHKAKNIIKTILKKDGQLEIDYVVVTVVMTIHMPTSEDTREVKSIKTI